MPQASNVMPWDEARMAASSHAQLYQQREKATSQSEQNSLANAEHRAFAREATADNPLMAVPIAAAIPFYQAKKVVEKAVGTTESRSDPSIEQMTEAYKGIGEGLTQAIIPPWEEAKKAAQDFSTSMGKAVDTVVTTVKGLMPWQEAQGAAKDYASHSTINQPKQIDSRGSKEVGDSKFEKIFANLIQAESRGKHTTASGALTASGVGAEGITQLMRKTAADPGYGVTPVKDKSEAEYIRFGKDYLKAMLNEFNGDYEKALAAYNFGPGAVKKAIIKAGEKGSNWVQHTPQETQKYIKKILGGIK